ncbi:MAG: hypothetical protein HRT66_00255 [Flavobacteriaceae bacterium]|nr:hypothetical protein [Flavobacteriaceae bacterium]
MNFIFLLFSFFFTCTQTSEFDLQKVVSQIGVEIDDVNISLVAYKVKPNNTNETIVVIPEEVLSEDGFTVYNSYVLIVDSKSNKVVKRYFENFKSTGWCDCDLPLKEIMIDTAPYFLSPNKRGFGIRVKLSNGNGDHMSEINLSLYIEVKTEIIKVLSNYNIETYESYLATTVCATRSKYKVGVLKITKRTTNGYNDLLIESKVTMKDEYGDDIDNCKETLYLSNEKEVLKFDGIEYLSIWK